MSAWVIALGLASGYLMQKRLQVASRLEEATKQFNEAAEPDNLPSEEIRAVQRTVPDSEKYEGLNMQDLTRYQVDGLVGARQAAATAVVQYENAQGLPPIEGVYLHYDNHGI
jgi:hypothetical protein